MNQTGSILISVKSISTDSALSKIINLVKSAQASKPVIGKLVDKVTAVFVPIVVIIAVSTFIVWSFISVPQAISASIAVLVIACPCALGLGTPIAMMIGSGKSAQYGILVRNGEVMQSASELTHIVFDKTGNITQGKPQVVDMNFYSEIAVSNQDIQSYVLSAEEHSEHPLAGSILKHLKDINIPRVDIDFFESLTGMGVIAKFGENKILIGNSKLMAKYDINIKAIHEDINNFSLDSATPIIVAFNGEVAATIAIKDPIKSDSKEAIIKLQKMGIKTSMISGDNKKTAEIIAKYVGIHTVFAEAMPKDKSEYISNLQQQGYKVGMVGDGINDAPALSQANVGFAMGSGTDIAIESADITMVNHSLIGVNNAIILSKSIMKNIKQSLFGAFIYNIVGIPIAAGILYPFSGVMLSPIFASAAMALSSITVVLSASRLRKLKL